MANAFTLNWLLKLPPTLRYHAIKLQPLTSPSLRSKTISQARQFSNTRTLQAKKRKVQKPPPASQKPPQAPSQHQHAIPTTPSAPPPSTSISRVSPTLQHLLKTTPEILLYHAPKQRSFFIHSYLLGAVFIGGGVVAASPITDDDARNFPWYVRLANVSGGIFLAMLGTVFILAPVKLIKSVHLVAPRAGEGRMQPFLRLRRRAALPFVRRWRRPEIYAIDAPIGEVQIEDKVLGDHDLPYYDVPISRAEEFTVTFSHPPTPSFTQRLRAFGRSIATYPKTFAHDVRRMFTRDGFAYLEIPDMRGLWKLDLRDSYLLDHGKPLTSAMVTVDELDKKISTRVLSVFFSSRDQ